MQRPASFLAGLSPEEFLAEHFQKQPRLVRGALPGYEAPITPEELAGLALEADVESRIVRETSGKFELRRGPFDADVFSELPATHWTLLVQDLDQHVPEVSELFGLLDFLPSFRLDDVMASYAVEGGSVGPHYDQYDVFLLQVSGSRRWQVSRQFDRSLLRDDTELCILSEFSAEQEWVLHPGDCLYLPPGVAHYGVAVEPCVTFSLGCRAPSVAEIVAHHVRRVLDELEEGVRYEDPDLSLEESGPLLGVRAVARVEALLDRHLRPGPDDVMRSFASLVTEPKALFADDDAERLDETSARRVLEEDSTLERRLGSRWLACDSRRGRLLFVNGREFPVRTATKVADALCREREVCPERLRAWIREDDARELLLALLQHGLLEVR